MDIDLQILQFAALAQRTRLDVLMELGKAPDTGRSAGDLGRTLHVAPSTLSFHLREFQAADLVSSQRQGRNVVYHLKAQTIEGLARHLWGLIGQTA